MSETRNYVCDTKNVMLRTVKAEMKKLERMEETLNDRKYRNGRK